MHMLAHAVALLAACLALVALILMLHRRFAGVDARLTAILRVQEQSVAEAKQQADELQRLRESMRTFCAYEAEVSDRLHEIKTVLKQFDRDLVALQRSPVSSRTHFAHRRALQEVAAQEEGSRDERKVRTWFTPAMSVPQEEQASSGARDSRASSDAVSSTQHLGGRYKISDKTHWRAALSPIGSDHSVAAGAGSEAREVIVMAPYVALPSDSSSSPCTLARTKTSKKSEDYSLEISNVNSTKERPRERRRSRRSSEGGGGSSETAFYHAHTTAHAHTRTHIDHQSCHHHGPRQTQTL